MATVYDFNLKDKKGNEVSLGTYKGKVLLIVNTATGCGFTPQYEDLEAMYHSLKDKGLEILDIPCDQFGHQAPGTDEEIGLCYEMMLNLAVIVSGVMTLFYLCTVKRKLERLLYENVCSSQGVDALQLAVGSV